MLFLISIFDMPPQRHFLGSRWPSGSSVHSHGITMLSLVKKFDDLKAELDNDMYIDVILQVFDTGCEAHICNDLQGYTLATATKLLNMALSKTVPQMPYEIWHSKPTSYKYLRVWGSPVYIKRLVENKLGRPENHDHLIDDILLIGNDVKMLSNIKAWLSAQFFMKDMGEASYILGYSDASFQTDGDDAKSQSGFVFKLNGGVVAWKSSKQATTVDSTTEAEYIVALKAAKEAVWMKN
ncbi:UNVERIFIED_CONTAM: Secreted RxLR effector protein [Sesamum calycinum]|uniref:Secreted RxLR effector protein n=1 Tax=Sesamum calycinum TaxID=2727403 RepID=A0AAW2M0U3_9LAMI